MKQTKKCTKQVKEEAGKKQGRSKLRKKEEEDEKRGGVFRLLTYHLYR